MIKTSSVVPAGGADQRSGGEMFSPAAVLRFGIGWPSLKAGW